MKSLIVGMGIGELYKKELAALGIQAITVDSNKDKNPDFLNIESAALAHDFFETVHICTPNFTHYDLASRLAKRARIVFVEKPGVQNADTWRKLVRSHSQTKIIMVKNNQYRQEIDKFKAYSVSKKNILIKWSNKNRIPNPGSWFTTHSLAYGGVSRDLMPHLLSYICAIYPHYADMQITKKFLLQNYSLADTTSSDYGTVNHGGTYDVDDLAKLELSLGDLNVKLEASWRNDVEDQNYLSFYNDYDAMSFQLGLCPDYAYGKMIKHCLDNLNNPKFWYEQYCQDIWIHEIIDQLCK